MHPLFQQRISTLTSTHFTATDKVNNTRISRRPSGTKECQSVTKVPTILLFPYQEQFNCKGKVHPGTDHEGTEGE